MTASLWTLLQLPWSPRETHASTSRPRSGAVRTHSTMRVRVFSADLGARALLELLPVPELRAHVLAFLSGPLEWTTMAVAARFGRLALLQALAEARGHQPRTRRPNDKQEGGNAVLCPSEAVAMARAHGHRDAERWLLEYMATWLHCCRRY